MATDTYIGGILSRSILQKYLTKKGHLVEFFKEEGNDICVKLVKFNGDRKPLSEKQYYWYKKEQLTPVADNEEGV